MYITTLLCTGVDRPPLEFKPPIPIDIDSEMGALVGAAPYTASGPYGLPTDSLTPVVRRNYEPHRKGWRLTGTLFGNFSASGYAEAPGEIDEDNPVIFPPDPLVVPFAIDIDSGPPLGTPVVRPEFATVSRVVAELSHEQPFVSSAFFPAGMNAEGDVRACYLVTTFSFTVELLPYSWERLGAYYLEHDIRIEATSELQFPLGNSGFSPDEGVSAGPGGNVRTQHPGPNIQRSGSVAVSDPLMITQTAWGSLDFWGSTSEAASEAGLLNPALFLRCSVHYLPSPDL